MFLLWGVVVRGVAAHSSQSGGDDSTHLPEVVPFDLPHLTRMSWELGSRVVEDEESALQSRWEHDRLAWLLSIFRVTDNTVILCVRTPAGRERFYGAAQSDLNIAFRKLAAAPSWRPRSE